MPESPTSDSAAAAENQADEAGDDLLAGFDSALRPQQQRTNAYRAVSPFAATDEERE